jgi:uncharacterized protein with HEPN domain
MREAAEEVRGFVATFCREDLDGDLFLARGLSRTLETIEEAASRVSRNFRDSHLQVNWQDWISLRNHLAHDYHSYDLDRVWRIATADIEPLIPILNQLISESDA